MPVSLVAEHGKVTVLIAHIPQGEVSDLLPNKAGSPPTPPNRADHFDAYYNLVRRQGSTGPETPSDRPVPENPNPTTAQGCVVGITTSLLDKAFIYEPRALGTYACMVASGQGM